jgi:hypothetical protein
VVLPWLRPAVSVAYAVELLVALLVRQPLLGLLLVLCAVRLLSCPAVLWLIPYCCCLMHLLCTRSCERCGFLSSQAVCKACILLEGLNSGLPTLGVGRTRGNQGNKNRGRRGNNAAAGAQLAASGGLIQLKLEEEDARPAAGTATECSGNGS